MGRAPPPKLTLCVGGLALRRRASLQFDSLGGRRGREEQGTSGGGGESRDPEGLSATQQRADLGCESKLQKDLERSSWEQGSP